MNQEEYQAIVDRCSSEAGPLEERLAALNPHDKRQIVEHQMNKRFPVFRACVTSDLMSFVKQQGYVGGYTNKSRSARYMIKTDNAMHARMMIRDVPIRQPNKPKPKPAGAARAIGQQLRQVRKGLKQDQAELAKAAGTRRADISDIELAKRNPTIQVLEQIYLHAGYRIVGLKLEKIDPPTPETEENK